MQILLMGPTGAGKGTQAPKLAAKFNIPHISTGELFRAHVEKGTTLGRKAKEYMEAGQLVPDAVTISMVRDRLARPDCKNGFILDGFPRTIKQADAMETILSELSVSLSGAVNINVPEEVLVLRTAGRRSCRQCGQTFHMIFHLPKIEGICDKCSGSLYQREDDREETVKKRLVVYRNRTQPLIEYYRRKGLYTEIDGTQPIDKVTKDILVGLGCDTE